MLLVSAPLLNPKHARNRNCGAAPAHDPCRRPSAAPCSCLRRGHPQPHRPPAQPPAHPCRPRSPGHAGCPSPKNTASFTLTACNSTLPGTLSMERSVCFKDATHNTGSSTAVHRNPCVQRHHEALGALRGVSHKRMLVAGPIVLRSVHRRAEHGAGRAAAAAARRLRGAPVRQQALHQLHVLQPRFAARQRSQRGPGRPASARMPAYF